MDASYRFANKDLCSLSFMIMSVTKCACTIYTLPFTLSSPCFAVFLSIVFNDFLFKFMLVYQIGLVARRSYKFRLTALLSKFHRSIQMWFFRKVSSITWSEDSEIIPYFFMT